MLLCCGESLGIDRIKPPILAAQVVHRRFLLRIYIFRIDILLLRQLIAADRLKDT
jgi:hypothetical protein